MSAGVRLDRHVLGPGMHAAFTDRRGGVSTGPYAELNLGGPQGVDDPAAVTKNRTRAAAALGVPAERVVWMRQVHGADVAVVDAAPDHPPEVDAVVTDGPGLALAVRVADCVPVLLADADAGVLAAAHAGRPGLAGQVVPAAVTRMRELGASPADTVAVVGPAVCGRCYEVPAALRDEVVAAAGVPAGWATTSWGTPAVDVPGGVVAQLHAAGVEAVTRVATCTVESPAHYSYRRDGETGRFAGYVWRDR